EDYDPGGGEEGGRVHKCIEGLGVEIGGGTLVDVQVARGRVDRALEEGAHRLILEHVLLAMEIVDGIRRALLQAPEQRVKGESPHTGRKLPWPRVERKPTAPRMPARRAPSRRGPAAPRIHSRAGPGMRLTAHRPGRPDSGRERAGAPGRALLRGAGRLRVRASRVP